MGDGRPQKTLYDEFEGTYAASIREEIFHSVTIVCKVGPHIDSNDVPLNFVINMIPQQKSPLDVTGILLVYPKLMVMILEAPIQCLLGVMHGLAASEILLKQTLNAYKSVNCYSLSEENDEEYENPSDVEIIRLMVKDPQSAPIIQSRILCILHNIPARMFRTFEVKTFGIEPVAVLPHFEPNEDEARLIELLHQLTRLCTYLACSAMKDQEEYVPEIYKMRMASLLDDLLEDHPELVPPLVDIWYFAEVSQLNGLISVAEYLDRNDKPDQLSDPTAQTWPLPTSSFLYT